MTNVHVSDVYIQTERVQVERSIARGHVLDHVSASRQRTIHRDAVAKTFKDHYLNLTDKLGYQVYVSKVRSPSTAKSPSRRYVYSGDKSGSCLIRRHTNIAVSETSNLPEFFHVIRRRQSVRLFSSGIDHNIVAGTRDTQDRFCIKTA